MLLIVFAWPAPGFRAVTVTVSLPDRVSIGFQYASIIGRALASQPRQTGPWSSRARTIVSRISQHLHHPPCQQPRRYRGAYRFWWRAAFTGSGASSHRATVRP